MKEASSLNFYKNTREKAMGMKKKHYICKIKPPETHRLKSRDSGGLTVCLTGTEKRCFQCLKTGVSHTPTIGVSHTPYRGLSHTYFKALKGLKMRDRRNHLSGCAGKGGA